MRTLLSSTPRRSAPGLGRRDGRPLAALSAAAAIALLAGCAGVPNTTPRTNDLVSQQGAGGAQ